ncbi:MAG: hypothetical protein EXR76_08285 [Myxococcales bacterium]|nr:hypothetical protein [Myxococcales bacterium]
MASSPKGIAPSVLRLQVQNTASWALESHAEEPWAVALRSTDDLDERLAVPEARAPYLRLLLAAHYATVGTFIPTDVDQQIRFHLWQGARTVEALRDLVKVVDEASLWDPRLVSAKVLDLGDGTTLSGHDGEWLGVRAGALGRALALGDDQTVEALGLALDAELRREAAIFASCVDRSGKEKFAACVAATLAHNLGDLSRVIEVWTVGAPHARELGRRYTRLGHGGGGFSLEVDRIFLRAGTLNKATMALENHRYLPLRDARSLRTSRDFLLPFPPFLDAFGERLGDPHGPLARDDLADVVRVLLEGHALFPKQAAFLRALAGVHRRANGGLDGLTALLPARVRKLIAAGPVREALAVDADRFEARFAKTFRTAASATRA